MKQVTNPTQQEMIKEIYEEMADKTLSIGCKCISKSHGEVLISLLFNLGSYNILSYNIGDKLPSGEPIYFEYQGMSGNTDIDDIVEIIGHPLRIGDVLDWIRIYTKTSEKYFYQEKMLLSIWKQKRNPIPLDGGDEREELVTYLYSLIR